MSGVPAFNYRKTVASPVDDSGDAVIAMDENGDVAEYSSPQALVRSIRKRDAAAARRGDSTATLIEWVGMPVGFTAPEIDA